MEPACNFVKYMNTRARSTMQNAANPTNTQEGKPPEGIASCNALPLFCGKSLVSVLFGFCPPTFTSFELFMWRSTVVIPVLVVGDAAGHAVGGCDGAWCARARDAPCPR